MTDFPKLIAADRGQPAHPVHLVDGSSFEDWLQTRPEQDRALLAAHRFDGTKGYSSVILPRPDGRFEVVGAVANVDALSPWCLARLAETLPEGAYRLERADPGKAALGWLLAQHRFDSYRSNGEDHAGPRVLVTGEVAGIDSVIRLAESTAMVRDLVDMPALELGPAELEDHARALAQSIDARVEVTSGDSLGAGFPLIAAVGAAAARGREPRLIELFWGDPANPRLAVVGKGVCFDTGGLDIKGGTGMRLMKKDMGGAAHALALARLVALERLPVHLHLLVPAVENSVSGNALRPGDVVRSRKGLTVEIDNTDAEGRLILADALALAVEKGATRIVDFATLTGAARVALGPDLPALFVNDEDFADRIVKAADRVEDPLWRMPLWDAYDEMLKSDLADVANSAATPMAGAVTAAMFLKRFLPDGLPWAHLDTFAWRDKARPGRPKGGDALGLRAIFEVLRETYER